MTFIVGQGHRSKVKVTDVESKKILVYTLTAELFNRALSNLAGLKSNGLRMTTTKNQVCGLKVKVMEGQGR